MIGKVCVDFNDVRRGFGRCIFFSVKTRRSKIKIKGETMRSEMERARRCLFVRGVASLVRFFFFFSSPCPSPPSPSLRRPTDLLDLRPRLDEPSSVLDPVNETDARTPK